MIPVDLRSAYPTLRKEGVMNPIGCCRNWPSLFMDYWAAYKAGLALRCLTNNGDYMRPLLRPIDEWQPLLLQTAPPPAPDAHRVSAPQQTSGPAPLDRLCIGQNRI